MTPHDILNFWFDELTPKQHFIKDPALDRQIKERFGQWLEAASCGELHHWRDSTQGRLAEIIVLDQFSRNIFRGKPRAFAQDATALALAQEMVRADMTAALAPTQRAFAYMPFMHSESSVIHEWAARLFAEPGLEDSLKWELAHKKIIDQFGRYPHRNAILGRPSSASELAFLKQPDSSF